MISVALSIALLSAGLTDKSAGNSQTLPAPPAGQVLDRMEWLNEDRRLALEAELGRLKTEHQVDLYVVIWDRRLPDGQRPEDLAKSLGESWSDGRLWGTVLLTPEAINRPLAVTGGDNLDQADRDHLASAANYSVEFGARAWTDQGRLEQTALVLGEELIFARQKMFLEDQAPSAPAPNALSATLQSPNSTLFPILLVLAGGLLVTIVLLLLKRKRKKPVEAEEPAPVLPSVLTFPSPQPRQRLGATWSGGASLVAKVPSPPSM